jgi:hypothetical protein
MSVGVGLGLLFLAREGISFAVLKQIPKPAQQIEEQVPEPEPRPARARPRPVRRTSRPGMPERVGSR